MKKWKNHKSVCGRCKIAGEAFLLFGLVYFFGSKSSGNLVFC